MKEHTTTCRYQTFEPSELPDHVLRLIEQARVSRSGARAPYSDFTVGAAVLLHSGNVVLGSNQENASFPAGLCAERVAAHQAMAAFPDDKIKAIAIVAGKRESDTGVAVAPCGICRQSLLEYELEQHLPITLYCSPLKGPVIRVNSIADLLPLRFDGSTL